MDAALKEDANSPVDMPSRSAPAAAPTKTRSRRPFIILGLIAAVVLLGIGLYSLFTAGKETTDDAQIEADVVPLAARVGGQVLAVHVQDNQRVKKGDKILELDPADYQARLEQATAEVATTVAQAQAADAQADVAEAGAKGGFSSAKAAVSGSGVAVANAEANIAAAKATLARAQSEARRTELDLNRTKELRAANAVSQERLDNAQVAHDSAQAAIEQARAQLTASKAGRRAAISHVAEAQGRLDTSTPVNSLIATAHAQAALAHARQKSAEAQLGLAKLQLQYTTVVAPQDGLVSKLSVHEGQLLGMGQALAELVPMKTYVVANFKETQMDRMRPGQPVQISIDAYPGKELEGRVESISGGTGARFSLLPADNASGNFVKVVQRVPVRIALTKVPADLPLRAGLSADVTVRVK